VGGLTEIPIPMPSDRARSMTGVGSGTASIWAITDVAPASANCSDCPSGSLTIRWHSSGNEVIRLSAFTTTGPIVIGGTKWPSIASTCRRSAYFSTRATSSPSRAKSAERIEGASLYRVLIRQGLYLRLFTLRTGDVRFPGGTHAGTLPQVGGAC